MKIYKLGSAEAFRFYLPQRESDYRLFTCLPPPPCKEDWTPVEMVRVDRDGGRKLQPSDFPGWAGGDLMLNERAASALSDVLLPFGELLPLTTDDSSALFVFNAKRIDALDEEKSKLLRLPDRGQVILVSEAVFKEELLAGVEAFRLPHSGTPIYVSQHFVARVREEKLVGLDFELAWAS